jgi:hypothetical protein
MAGIVLLCRLVAFALVLQVSGLPALIVELVELDNDCCEVPCEGADDEGHCPPNCRFGTCAKTITALLVVSSPLVGRAELVQALELVEISTPPSGFERDVFHPPRV